MTRPGPEGDSLAAVPVRAFGHVFPEAEDLVEEHEDYGVVQKHADVSATRSD